jgi:hypothetical protein
MVSEIKLSDFKMFEKAPYDKLDTKNTLEINMRGAKEREKVYGPAFTTKFIKYALMAVTSQTKEAPPKDIKTLDQLTEYLLSKSEKLVIPPYFAVLWAQFVTDQKFEGSLAAGIQLMYRGVTKGLAKSDGETGPQNIDIDQTLEAQRKLSVNMKVAPLEFGYKKNADGTVNVIHGGCFYFWGCKMGSEQGLLNRSDGRMFCGCSSWICQFLKKATSCEWDYTVLEFSEPHCMVRFFTI